jgi:DNA-binding transcriptional LysR family regulator
MLLNKIDLNLFVVFDTIYQERNLTRAADMLHITQPAVSNSLARLRRHFNDQLFIRQSGHMVPTPLAENISGRIREALASLESSLTAHDNFDPTLSERRFRFSMNDTSESYLLPLLMERLQSAAPGILIESAILPREELTKAFAAGELDFALDVPLINTPQLKHQRLRQERFVCIARKDHPRIDRHFNLDQYLAESHISISSRRTGQSYVDIHLNRLGLERKVQLRVQQSRAAAPIIARSDLLLTIPNSLVDQTKFMIQELPFALPALDWHLYWAANYDNDKAHQWMREIIFDIFATLQPVSLF